MYERRKLKDLEYGDEFVFEYDRKRVFKRRDYDNSDNTYLVIENYTNAMMWLSAEKEVFVQTYRW